MKLFQEWFNLGGPWTCCKFKLDGKSYDCVILERGENHIVVKPYCVDGIYEPIKNGYTKITLTKDTFDEIDLHIFDDLRGCDDSAIGLDGNYEPWRYFENQKKEVA